MLSLAACWPFPPWSVNNAGLGDTVDSEPKNVFYSSDLGSRWKVLELIGRLPTNQQQPLLPPVLTLRTPRRNASCEDGRMTGKNVACLWPWPHRITTLQINKTPCQRHWPKQCTLESGGGGALTNRQVVQAEHDWYKPSLWSPLLSPKQAQWPPGSPHSRLGIPLPNCSSMSGQGFMLPSAGYNSR